VLQAKTKKEKAYAFNPGKKPVKIVGAGAVSCMQWQQKSKGFHVLKGNATRGIPSRLSRQSYIFTASQPVAEDQSGTKKRVSRKHEDISREKGRR